MTTSYKDLAGNDLDAVFELAPSEAYSIYANIVGEDLEPFERIVICSAGQMNTNNGVTDLLKRYLWKGFGSAATSTGHHIVVGAQLYDGQGDNVGPVHFLNTPLASWGAAINSSGGPPSWNTSTGIFTGNSLVEFGANYKTFTMPLSVLASAFPITSYTITSTSVTFLSGNSIEFTGSYEGARVNGSNLELDTKCFTDNSGSSGSQWRFIVKVKAHSVAGVSGYFTATFDITYNTHNVGGGGGNDL